jgi:hypothetical protein
MLVLFALVMLLGLNGCVTDSLYCGQKVKKTGYWMLLVYFVIPILYRDALNIY